MALGLFLVGVPVCLVTMVGNPLPAGMPEWSAVVAAIESGAVPAAAVSGVLAFVVWIWWSQVALSFAAEVRAACRGRTARSLPLRGLGMQPVMVRLVAIVVAATGTVGALAQPVLAGSPSFTEIAVPIGAGETSSAPAGEGATDIPAAAGMSSLAPVAGSLPAPILGPPETAGADPEPAARVPILGAPSGSRPAQSPVRPAPSVERATSARWDPVVATQAALPVDQVTAAEPGEVGWVVVKPGDSLWLLAERHLGDALRWPDIFELNVGQLEGGGTLRDPNLIHPGWRLRLPPPDEPDQPDQPAPATPVAAVAMTAPVAPVEGASG